MSMADRDGWIWYDGRLVPWREATTHVLTHTLHYGMGVFEGVRCYETEIGPAIFRHDDHISRLEKSAELYYMPIPYSHEEIRTTTKELIARNGLRSCYIRPLVFRGYGTMGLFPLEAPVDVCIAVWEWGAYLGDEGKRNGIRAKVASWRRISGDALIPHAKASGQYLNSILAKTESAKAGYEEERRVQGALAVVPEDDYTLEFPTCDVDRDTGRVDVGGTLTLGEEVRGGSYEVVVAFLAGDEDVTMVEGIDEATLTGGGDSAPLDMIAYVVPHTPKVQCVPLRVARRSGTAPVTETTS